MEPVKRAGRPFPGFGSCRERDPQASGPPQQRQQTDGRQDAQQRQGMDDTENRQHEYGGKQWKPGSDWIEAK